MGRYTYINPSILIGELPLEEQLRRVAEAGFSGVELWWPFEVPDPSEAEVDRVIEIIRASGLTLIGLNSYEGGMALKNRGIACWPDVDREFDAAIEVARRIAVEFGCGNINVLHGVLRSDEPREVQDARAAVRTARAADALAADGIIVTLEQLSHIEGYGLRTVDELHAALDRARAHLTRGTILIQVDLFHLFNSDIDVSTYFAERHSDIGHVQVADFPGRGAPGTGEQPIDALLDQLLEQGYDRLIALEYERYEGDPFAGVRP